MSRYQVVTWTRLTAEGQVGAALLVTSPIVELFLWRYFLDHPTTPAIFLLGVAGAVSLAGLVMVIVGREQHSNVVSQD